MERRPYGVTAWNVQSGFKSPKPSPAPLQPTLFQAVAAPTTLLDYLIRAKRCVDDPALPFPGAALRNGRWGRKGSSGVLPEQDRLPGP